jgi:hypothetical protein
MHTDETKKNFSNYVSLPAKKREKSFFWNSNNEKLHYNIISKLL